jgi:glycosyltransferase involved in cell wall biosynthesis
MSIDISIIIPTYNRSHKIIRAIDSILAQSSSAWELIIIDDGSTDDTQNVIHEKQLHNPRANIQCFYQHNSGPAIARNFGVRNASAPIITYLDSDDRFYPEAVATILECMGDPASLYGVPNQDRTLRLIDPAGKEIASKPCYRG